VERNDSFIGLLFWGGEIYIKLLRHHEGLIYISAGNIFGAALTGIFWLLLASIQSVNDYGHVNYTVAIGSLAASISLLGLNTTVTTLLPKGNAGVNVQANQIILISASLCAIVVSLFDWILGFFVIGMAFWMMASYELLGRKMYRNYALNVIGARGSQLVLSLFLYYYLGVFGILLGFVISFFVFSRVYLKTIRLFSKRFEEIKDNFGTSLHLYSYNLSNAFLLYFDKLLIAPIFGYATLGYYQLGFQFLMFFSMIPVSFYQYLIPEEASGKKKNKLRLYGIGLSIVLTALLFVLSPYIIHTFFPNYIGSLNSMKILSIGIIPMMVIGTLNSRFLSLHKTIYVVIGSAVYQTLQIILMLYLGNQFGIVGISIAVVLALTGQSLTLFYCHLRSTKIGN
jgi:O-antigen/teichoic acid export membrane protein